MNLAAPLVGSLETQYSDSYTSLTLAISQAQQTHSVLLERSWGGYNARLEHLSPTVQSFLALSRRMPSSVALDAFPLLLTSLLIFSHPFGPGYHTECPLELNAMSVTTTSLRERLVELSALANDHGAGPPPSDVGIYRSQYSVFSELLALETEVAKISRRLMLEMNRTYPRAPVMLAAVFELKRLLKRGDVPFWLVHFCDLPDRLVRLSHL